MAAEPTTLGLARHRQKKGVSLEQIAERTKIGLRFLRAIEAEEYHQLPGGIFTISYLRQYASLVDLDPTELLAHYTESITPRPKPVGREGSRAPRSLMNRFMGTNPQTQQ